MQSAPLFVVLTRAQLKSIGTVGGATSSFGMMSPFATISSYTCLEMRNTDISNENNKTTHFGKLLTKKSVQCKILVKQA